MRLLEAYPDACVIWTHRDPADVLPSYVSLCAHFRSLFEKDVDRPQIALEQKEAWARAVENGMRLRKGASTSSSTSTSMTSWPTRSAK